MNNSASIQDELDRIWNKWDQVSVPYSAERRCQEATKGLFEFFFSINEILVDNGLSDRNASHAFGEKIGEVITYLSKASLFVGLEYGSAPSAKEATRLVELACVPTAEFTIALSRKFTEWGFTNDVLADQMQSEVSQLMVEAAERCYLVGVDISGNFNA